MKNKTQFIIIVLVFGLLLCAHPLLSSKFYKFVLCVSLINVMLVTGLHYISGMTGQIHMGQTAFWGLGAYTMALAITRLGIPYWITIVMAAVVAGLAGVALGIPTMKLGGYYLSMTTIGFAEIVRLVLMNWASVTGGVFGVFGIPRPSIFGFSFTSDTAYYYLIWGITFVLVIICSILEHSKFGSAFRAVRDDELAAEAAGIDTTRIKIIAFALCGVYAGLAGAFYTSLLTYISPEIFTREISLALVMMLVVGGIGSLPGAILGAVGLTFLPEVLRFLKDWYLAVYGIVVIAIIVYKPEGLIGMLSDLVRRLRPASSRKSASTEQGMTAQK